MEAASGNKHLSFDDQLEDENLGIGNDTWTAVVGMTHGCCCNYGRRA